PLRERREDVPQLVGHFMARMATPGGRRIGAISEDALRMLQAYDWPGNIRQLENAVFRATVLSDGDVLTSADFPQIRAQVDGIELSSDVVGVEVPRTFVPSASPSPAPAAAQPAA
ncbi:sigma-54-dependent Fis family transcriptional regulator, partial [Rhizobiaceae sp. 2RAB30]